MAVAPEIQDLLKAGVHFGHQSSRWNPKMRKYIFAARNGIHVIDLKKTHELLQEAQEVLREIVTGGNRVLFVCTKRQLRGIVEEEAERCGAFYVTERWLGGMLTNFQTIRKQIRRLKELERGIEEGAYEFYTKKEQLLLEREREKLNKYLVGVKDMGRLPGAIFVVDAKKEEIAVREANKLEIPVVAIADTNADPDMIDYPIPGNDDAIRSVSVITKAIADAVEMARREMPEDTGRAEEGGVTYSSEHGAQEVDEKPAPKRPKRRPKKRRPRPEAIKQVKPVEPAEKEAAGAEEAEAKAAEVETETQAEPEAEETEAKQADSKQAAAKKKAEAKAATPAGPAAEGAEEEAAAAGAESEPEEQ
jgi:small subunit ribosomal protein S2